jgi:hypothetical protein
MIYALVLMACNPNLVTACERIVLGTDFGSLQSCLVASRPAAADWGAQHPGRDVEMVRCVPAESLASETGRGHS